jgi:hypothetical protein
MRTYVKIEPNWFEKIIIRFKNLLKYGIFSTRIPLIKLIPRVTNYGAMADYGGINMKIKNLKELEDKYIEVPEENQRKVQLIKFLYVVGRKKKK